MSGCEHPKQIACATTRNWRANLKPHYLLNTLNAIAGLVSEEHVGELTLYLGRDLASSGSGIQAPVARERAQQIRDALL